MTLLGLRQYIKMSLGLKDSGTVFQCCIHETLEECPGAIPYIDDILVYACTKEEHDHNLEQMLQALHVHNFRLQLSRCCFCQAMIK